MLNDLDAVLHVARALSEITGRKELVVVGSAAVIAAMLELNGNDFGTEDVDIFSLDGEDEERFTDEAEVIGRDSQFHETYGYYADGVGPKTAIMPADWKSRAERRNVPGAPGVVLWVPEVNDVALAKLSAWRDKDIQWLKIAAREGVIEPEVMASRFSMMMQTDHTPPLAELARRSATLRQP